MLHWSASARIAKWIACKRSQACEDPPHDVTRLGVKKTTLAVEATTLSGEVATLVGEVTPLVLEVTTLADKVATLVGGSNDLGG